MKKLVSIILILVMVFSMGTVAFGDSTNTKVDGKDVIVTQLSNNVALVSENGVLSKLTIETDENIVTTTVKNLQTNEEVYFERDIANNTLYSSMTGYEGTVESPDSQMQSGNVGIYRISYRTLSLYVGIAAGAATVAAGVCAYAGIEGVAGLATIVAGILAIISAGLALCDENSGVTYEIGIREITKHQGGRTIVVEVERVVDIGTY